MAFCFDVHIKIVRKMEIYIYIMIYINKGTCLMARVMLGGDDNGARGRRRGRRFGASIFGDG